ncbi:histidine kinase [Actinoplanes sp. NPDC049802]|uniref:sensor histidine kinase n=1 Tax=Actinoplanes sp. NPDC049802 TaxID=3154742 RepID=UPI0033D016F5
MTRLALAVPRCLVLSMLAVAGLAYGLLLLAAATLVLPYPAAAVGRSRLTALGRRLARDWAGADLPDPVRQPPPAPLRRADGWYLHGNTLYRSRAVAAWLIRMEHFADDPETGREWRWLILAPVTSAVPVIVPAALLATGVLLARTSPWVTLAAVAAAFLLAPAGLRRYGRSTHRILQGEFRLRPIWISRASASLWRGAGLAGFSLAVLGAAILTVIATVVSWGGLLPWITAATRPLTEAYRRYAGLPSPYRPPPPAPQPEDDGAYRVGRTLYPSRSDAVAAQRYGWIGRDPATWRDLLWSLTAVVTAPLTMLPAIVFSVGVFGLVWQPLTWAPWGIPVGIATGHWVTPFYLWYGLQLGGAVPSWIPGWTSVLTGAAIAAAGLAVAGPMLRLRRWWDRLLLGPTAAAALASRVEQLSASRADTVDAQAAELRRIERDLHDGAQARLVAVGLGLATVARLMDSDPRRARQVLAQAQETSATALEELRRLVRGIHPPVLAERGLADAVRAIALDTPLPVTVHVDVPGRLDPAVESAVYFAACEALANAARVASRVSFTLTHHDDRLRMIVMDDGPGGADPAAGTGLRGIIRRLAAFDGTLTLHSPVGGPTVLTMEVPCASSSPKTSTC